MSDQYSNEPMLEMYLYETSQLIEQLEEVVLANEKSSGYTSNGINEVFRIMHTIKGSSAMMLFNHISTLANSLEDIFFYIREQQPENVDCAVLSDLVLAGIDFIGAELDKIKAHDDANGDSAILIENNKEFLAQLKQCNPQSVEVGKPPSDTKEQYYITRENIHRPSHINAFKATIFFEDGCEMENIRAYAVTHNLKEIAEAAFFLPEDLINNEESVQIIRENGFRVFVKTEKSYQEMHDFFMQILFIKDLELIELENDDEFKQFEKPRSIPLESSPVKIPQINHSAAQDIVSVNVTKLNNIMDSFGEMVIAEAMVTQNPDLKGLRLNNFKKAARHLHKITSELQDMIMSIRMVPVSAAFQKMHRIVRDGCKKLGKEVQLKFIGEETEVDRKIIEQISDPLMHLVRNSMDHGIETAEERAALGKPKTGTITLQAKNDGSDVLITVGDDGRGLNKEKILKRAEEHELLKKPETEMTDKEIYNLIFLPGFSTKDSVTEFSGRGVGMDVVTKNIESVGGTVLVDSIEGAGSTITMKIPLTLAIIDGMNVRVGNSHYIIPITSVRESFRPKLTDIITDPDGNEMIMVRGQCYPILRLHELYEVKSDITAFDKGIMMMLEQNDQNICIFADELLGQMQVVVKALPQYIKNTGEIKGIAGCTLLGDGSVSLIIDVAGLMSMQRMTG